MSLTPEEKQRIEEEEILRAKIRKQIEATEKISWATVLAEEEAANKKPLKHHLLNGLFLLMLLATLWKVLEYLLFGW